jgi:HD-GYP domain-containing protein (c-di-GMP phosphodiesterase class II)
MSAIAATNSTAASLCTSATSGYMSVKVEMLRRLSSAAVDLFVQYKANGPVMLYHRAGSPIEAKQFRALADANVRRLFVRTDDFQCFGAHLLESMDLFVEGEPVSHAERYAVLQLALAMEIERSSRAIDCGPYVALAEKVGQELVSLLGANQVLPRDLFRLARHDFNTFTHVTNVAGYAVILAERLGISEPSILNQVAVGAMLHDIGKRFIPVSILTKPGCLEPDEREVIEMHPTRGYEDLCRRQGLSHEQLMVVYQHHERINGTGYPVGSCGDEIHPWARMLAVVDVFDAMTGIRPYRRSATSRDALDYLRKNAGSHFDREVVQCWDAAMTKA